MHGPGPAGADRFHPYGAGGGGHGGGRNLGPLPPPPGVGGGARGGYGNDGDSWDGRAPRFHRDKPFAKKRKPTGKSGGKSYSKSAGTGAGKPSWDDVKPGKPMGAGKAKKKASKKRPAFKPGQEPWAGKSTGSPGFSVKPKGRGKRR